MKNNLRLLIPLLIVALGFTFLSLRNSLPAPGNVFKTVLPIAEAEKGTEQSLKKRAGALKAYASKNNMDSAVCFLINMNIASGENRFFIYDLKEFKILDKGLVTHGRCNQRFLIGRKYGNEVGCGCTSLGKYKVGKKYTGRFGLAYKLHGLDEGNSNAFQRFVVLHSHECVPEAEVVTPICQSDGCPTVAPDYLKRLSAVIDTSKQPILMEIFDE